MEKYFQATSDLLLSGKCHSCGNPNGAEISGEIIDAADEGDIDVVKDYLEKGGDVNATNEGECLLYRACGNGRTEIVKLLLQCPDIHLNNNLDDCSPFEIAIQYDHLECVHLLLEYNTGCILELGNNWNMVSKYLKTRPDLHVKPATYILRSAILNSVWDVIQLLLETKCHFIYEDLDPLIQNAVFQNRWDIVFSALQRNFYGKIMIVQKVFGVAVKMRSWDKAREAMKFIPGDLKFAPEFIEAAFSNNITEAEKLLSEANYDSNTLNGNLLVVAAGGISDPIADLLMTVKNVYTREVYSSALFLSAFSFCGELTEKLLKNDEASFSLNDMGQAFTLLHSNDRCEISYDILIKRIKNYNKNVRI